VPLFDTQEARLADLDALPRALWLGGLTHGIGTLEPRLAGLRALHAALVAGTLAPAADWPWPPPAIAQPLAGLVARIGLARHCAAQPELVNTVLQSLLFHLDLIASYIDRGDAEPRATERAIEAFAGEWTERCGQMDELTEVFGLLPDDAKHTRWDELRGLLRSDGWQQVLRIRALLEHLPELARIIRQLGRAQQTDEPDDTQASSITVMEQASAFVPQRRTVRVPDLPGETRGIQRSDRIARMLPAEAMLLGHPTLRLVWHARRAERTLLGYEDDDRMQELTLHETAVWRPVPRPQPDRRLEMGPILVCVDTSGSMQAGAEAVAKATVLEAMRTAHAQRRACHVFAFGGDGEVLELDLPVNASGIGTLVQFLGQSFHGGTDICGPIDRTLAKIEQADWQLADLLIATDGEFGATRDLVARLREAKARRGLRVCGVLIGDRETLGMLELADDLFWVRDWRRYGGQAIDSPVHDKALTAMYFPGALRNPVRERATVSGSEASAAIRAGLHQGEYVPPEARE
jgi:uncharacterized protein with von Willebrand factor type A (vWA) domain